ncbi:MAG: M15 family metallopeptidase [Clostridia bacterium]|nr:M15 family metallopeptidase [Clostridia bacterium]
MITIKKNDIISVKSTLSKKDYGKKVKRPPHSDIKVKSNNMHSLKLALIIIPIVMVVMIAAVLFFGIREFFSHIDQNNHYENALQTSTYSDTDAEKLLTIVSPSNALPSGYKLNLVDFENIRIDAIVSDSLRALMEDAQKSDLSLQMQSGYISTEEQNELYNLEVQRLMDEKNDTRAKAQDEAALTVPKGNHAEQQTGLAVAFASKHTARFEQSGEYRWLLKNAYKYGFVLRYPEGQEDQTEMPYNPSLFRYVGKENAQKMTTLNFCLDRYVVYLNAR